MNINDKTNGWHGSPYQLTYLLPGSTITQDRHLAEIFSHKPSIVSLEDDGRIRHNGRLPGNIYQIENPFLTGVLEPVPNSTMPPGLEWLTERELKIRLINRVVLKPEEFLQTDEIVELLKKVRT